MHAAVIGAEGEEFAVRTVGRRANSIRFEKLLLHLYGRHFNYPAPIASKASVEGLAVGGKGQSLARRPVAAFRNELSGGNVPEIDRRAPCHGGHQYAHPQR